MKLLIYKLINQNYDREKCFCAIVTSCLGNAILFHLILINPVAKLFFSSQIIYKIIINKLLFLSVTLIERNVLL